MQFDAALAAQETFRRAESEPGSDWAAAIKMTETFSPTWHPQFNLPPLDILQSVTY